MTPPPLASLGNEGVSVTARNQALSIFTTQLKSFSMDSLDPP